jgi:hypothetical protein
MGKKVDESTYTAIDWSRSAADLSSCVAESSSAVGAPPNRPAPPRPA